MAARGVHFAITQEQRAGLESCADDEARIDYIASVIEEPWEEDFLQQSDKAWDAIHRCLSDFPPETPWFYPVAPESGAYALPEDHGSYPLKLCILGGKKLQQDESSYFIRLIEPREVIDLAAAMQEIDKPSLAEKYWTHCRGAWPEYGEDDLEYTWEYFELLRNFFIRMAGNGRTVIFTADQ